MHFRRTPHVLSTLLFAASFPLGPTFLFAELDGSVRFYGHVAHRLGLKYDFDASILFIAERLVKVGSLGKRSLVGDHE